ncbi:MAG: Rpn family recombination-promoting nuclease/putative transposase [Oscillospiraceae bacterium]|nr:Rpn family recombination-promoting nuclease/putative transposase [Oscillospiraceae bacterium]
MVIRHEDLIGTYEQKRALVSQFNLMDDTFFAVVMRNKDACEYLLSALLGKPIKVIENKTQYSLRNIENHSVVLDALVEDDEHKLYNVEIQINDKKDHGRRMRYYHTAIDWSYLEKGEDYENLPELYMILISVFDPFKKNKNHYEVKQYVDDTTEYDDGIHRLYFNTEVDDGTGLSKLLQYLKLSEASNNNFGALSQAVNYHKVKNEGVDFMCKAVEEYAKEQRLEGNVKTVKNLLKKGIPLETALECAELDKETYEKYAERVQ